MRSYKILIPVAALAIVLPLLAHGCSCGHDFSFHLQSWLEAANQFRHGTLYPRWAFSAAFNAGEPRFVFYPPVSWMLGALLVLTLPAKLVTTAYTFAALTAAGFTMYRLASHFAAPRAAIIATILYIANPYMLFTAFERTAYAELLAAAWLPLLFLAALRRRPTVTGIALPVALLWLTNAPAAVMGCYALAVIFAVRLLAAIRAPRIPEAQAPGFRNRALDAAQTLAIPAVTGTMLGLALSAVYLIPAAYGRRFVQIAMAIIPNMRFEDNFLFGHTDDAPHNAVLHTASLISLELLAATATALALYYMLRTRKAAVILSAQRRVDSKDPDALPITTTSRTPQSPPPLSSLATLTIAIAILLTPISTPIWRHVPELAFLQFPWRMLSILAVCFALGAALALTRHRDGYPVQNAALWRHERAATTLLAAAILAVVVPLSIHVFRQPCEAEDIPATHARLFAAHTGVAPTDEYTPTDADNDVLRADDPPYWFAADPAAFAANTTPNPAATPGAPLPDSRTPVSHAPVTTNPDHNPFSLQVDTPSTGYLILNLRDYPNWNVCDSGESSMSLECHAHIARDDGLIAIPFPAGKSTVYVRWQRSLADLLGDAMSLTAFAIFVILCIRARSRRIELQAT